ncbi:MAG: hypothetical protein AB7Y46_08070 [Armatimonadota bacterium]
MSDEPLVKAIGPGAPATGARDRADLDREARRAARHAQYAVAALREEMVGLMCAYERAVAYARQAEAASPRRRAAIRADLKALRDRTERAAQGAIRNAYTLCFGYGKRRGWNWRDTDEAEDKFLLRLRREEFVFVQRFLDDIDGGRTVMPVAERAALYGNAASEAMWWGYLYADLSPDRYVRWVTHPAEHCPDCLFLAGELGAAASNYLVPTALHHGGRWGNGVYAARELADMGIVPQSGALRCTTNCKCTLQRVARPKRPPKSGMARERFRSLQPKPVQPQYEERRKRYLTRRVKRDSSLAKSLKSVRALLDQISAHRP